ncbi:hypothetical protein [Candidatus Entotheonella palauensis]|uniref:Uncharacterized protein n=1 Tax=Candidatus Entotheonella gemina TaxID=1429439 RepID=W4M9K4_9BACT|nr:hypothetical protein [Candidatus Entotheonella palauensis]ETX07064.1 MAG: hypothetical protein ETSY2_13365 [Candidatus Entotheonella gemina]
MADSNLDERLERIRSIANKSTPQEAETPQRQRRTSALFATSADETPAAAADLRVEQTQVYQILVDTGLESEQKVEAIADLLVLDFTDPDNDAQQMALAEVGVMIAALIEDFTEQSRQSIQMTQNNPLSQLTENIREVFENYHQLVQGRAGLQQKLGIIQGLLEQNGGDELQLLRALSDAQNKKDQKEALESQKMAAETALKEATDHLQSITDRETVVSERLAEIGDGYLWFQGDLKTERTDLKQEKLALTRQTEAARDALRQRSEAFEQAERTLSAFLGDDYEIYEQILEILDIGNEEFREELSRIASQTLAYIDQTGTSLTGVRNQLAELLEEVKSSSNLSFNTSDKITILQRALTRAQDRNVAGFSAFNDKAADASAIPGLEDLGELDERKIRDQATQFTSELKRNIASTTQLSGNVATHYTTLQQMRTDLEDGVNSADGQLLQAVATASTTGQTIVLRIQRLAAMAQKIVSDSMYQEELATTFNEVVKDFETGLQAQLQRNSTIEGFGKLTKDLTEALDAKNEATYLLAKEQEQLVQRLAQNVDALQQANQRARELDTTLSAATLEGEPAQTAHQEN